MRDNNIKPAEAADILGVSPQFVRVAMQQGKLNIGICSKEAIETDSGYVITQKGVKGNEDKKRAESTGNMYRSQA